MSDKSILKVDGQLKDIVVEYVGEKLQPKNNEITLEMVIETLAAEFPEVVLALAEENFLRGYAQGIEDLEVVGVKASND
jgi:hypothetical protein